MSPSSSLVEKWCGKKNLRWKLSSSEWRSITFVLVSRHILSNSLLPRVFELKAPPLPPGLMCACCKPSETDLDTQTKSLILLEYKGEEDSTCFLVDKSCSLAYLPNSHGCGTVVLFEPKLRRLFVHLMTSSPLNWPGSKRSKYISQLLTSRRKLLGCAARLTRSQMDCRLQG